MGQISGLGWPVILAFVNLIFSSAIVITAFSLLGYMLTHNLRSNVAQAFSVLLACVLLVYACDIIIPRVEGLQAVVIWLRVQWIGIAIVPAAYFHFSDALLRSTRHFSRRRRVAVVGSYLFSIGLVLLALFTDALVSDGNVIRLPIPKLNEERRRELTRLVRAKAEEGRVAVRNVRRDAIEDLRSFEKEGEITKDDLRRGQEEAQKLTDRYVAEIDEMLRVKEKELLEV